MNTIEQASNEETLAKPQIPEDDIDSKHSISTEARTTLSPFQINLTSTTTQCASLSSKNDPSEISDTDSLPEKDTLTPLGNPNLKDLKYIETEIPIYANLYKIELERNYTLYEYAVTFAHEKDDKYSLSTMFKQRIMNTVSSQIAQKFRNFLFIGGALFSEKRSKEVLRSPPNIIL